MINIDLVKKNMLLKQEIKVINVCTVEIIILIFLIYFCLLFLIAKTIDLYCVEYRSRKLHYEK